MALASRQNLMKLLLLLSFLPFFVLSKRDSIPKHIHDKLRNAQSFLDVVDKVHVIYHPEKTNSHIEKSFPTSAPRQEVRINAASFTSSKGKNRKLAHAHSARMMADSPPQEGPMALHDEVDSHTADHLSLFSSIKQGNDTCQLQSVCVPVPIETEDPQIVIFPKCYEVMQCVGSCCESYETCHPHSIRKVQKPIVELIYVGNDRFMLNKTMNITMEEHISCSCFECTDAPQCADGFVLGPDCECQCVNRAEGNNCRGQRRWDEQKCSCTCEGVTCPRGEWLDRQKCECISTEVKISSSTADLTTTESPRGQQIDIASLPRLKAVKSKIP